MIPACLTLSNIRYVSRVKWSNPGKGVAPSPTSRCCNYWKGNLRSPSTTFADLKNFLLYTRMHTHTHTHTCTPVTKTQTNTNNTHTHWTALSFSLSLSLTYTHTQRIHHHHLAQSAGVVEYTNSPSAEG